MKLVLAAALTSAFIFAAIPAMAHPWHHHHCHWHNHHRVCS
jgi:hypothetical protein